MAEQEVKLAQKAQLYDLRLMFTSGGKDAYTTQEIVELQIGRASCRERV